MGDTLPKGWKWVKLGEIVFINSKNLTPNYPYDEIYYLDTGSVAEGRLVSSYKKFYLKEAPSRAKRIVNDGDIVYSLVRPIQRHYGIIKNPPDNLIVSTGFAVITADNNKADNRFIYYYLTLDEIVEYLDSIAEGSTTTYPSIVPDDLKNIIIPLPPLPEQKAIAEVLSSLDDKIELLHRQNKTLEEMAMTIFRKWFIEDAKEYWGDGVFGDIVQPKKGKNITKKEVIEGPYPVVAGGIEPSCYHNLANTSEPVITISASGANAGYVRLYHTKVWASDSSYIDYSVTPYVYFSYIFLKTNQRALFDKQVGSVQPHVYPMQIMELNCMHYPEKLISKFEKWCTPMFTKIKSNQIQIRILEQMRDILLPKLMNGEVRVYDCEFTEKEEDYERN